MLNKLPKIRFPPPCPRPQTTPLTLVMLWFMSSLVNVVSHRSAPFPDYLSPAYITLARCTPEYHRLTTPPVGPSTLEKITWEDPTTNFTHNNPTPGSEVSTGSLGWSAPCYWCPWGWGSGWGEMGWGVKVCSRVWGSKNEEGRWAQSSQPYPSQLKLAYKL